jgi:hypothetical protein
VCVLCLWFSRKSGPRIGLAIKTGTRADLDV